MTLYLVCCTFIFLFGLHTALEDVTLMRQAYGEPDYPQPSLMSIGALLVVSLIPGLNLILLGFTILYRKGMI